MSWLDDPNNGNNQNTNPQNASPEQPKQPEQAPADSQPQQPVTPPDTNTWSQGWSQPTSSVPQQTPSASQKAENTGNAETPSTGEYHYTYPERRYQADQQPTQQPTPPTGQQPTGQVPPYQPQRPAGQPYTPYNNYTPYNWQSGGTQPPKPPKKKHTTGILIGVIGGVCAVAIITLSVLLVLAVRGNNNELSIGAESDTSSSQQQGTGTNGNAPKLQVEDGKLPEGELTTKSIIQKNLNSTVVINMYDKTTTGGFMTQQQSIMQKVGGATGIIMTKDGYIITNAHCVINENTNEYYARIDVKTYDGTVYENAKVVGADSDTDIAVLRVSPKKDLQSAEFGKSSAVELGDRVVALGNAGGLEWTPTTGILSGKARDVYTDSGYAIKCLQTDAAINPGNSGGPLLNAYGQVIGINSTKIAGTEYEGLGFSIPIEEAKTIIDSLIKDGYVKGRVALGITVSPVQLANVNGLMIAGINEDSSLKGTQAQKNDIITAIDGKEVTDYSSLRTELAKHSVGDKVTLRILRVTNGNVRSMDITCTLKESK